MRKRLYVLGLACFAMLVVASSAMASGATYDLSSVSTGFQAQVQNGVTTILPIAGPLIALFVAWRVLKRMAKA
jgi:hypothetical protein